MTESQLLDFMETTIDRPIQRDRLDASLIENELDSLDVTTIQMALEERYGNIEFPLTDDAIDPNWTVREFIHFISAHIDRFDER